jgi:hypothetical protein
VHSPDTSRTINAMIWGWLDEAVICIRRAIRSYAPPVPRPNLANDKQLYVEYRALD